MKDVKDYEKDVPPTEKTITFETTGKITKKRYVGEFVAKIQNIQDQINTAKQEAQLNGEFAMYLEPGIRKMNKMLAYLKYSIVGNPYPKFWIDSELGQKLRDPNVVEELYNEVMKFEEEWLKSIWKEEPTGSAKAE